MDEDISYANKPQADEGAQIKKLHSLEVVFSKPFVALL
jgi:hypothetical protein